LGNPVSLKKRFVNRPNGVLIRHLDKCFLFQLSYSKVTIIKGELYHEKTDYWRFVLGKFKGKARSYRLPGGCSGNPGLYVFWRVHPFPKPPAGSDHNDHTLWG
jgi:hypothetical protein